MKIIKRLKTLGLAAVTALGALLPAFPAITASAATGDTYFNTRRYGDGYALTNDNLSALQSNVSDKFTLGKLDGDYTYMVSATNDTTVSVNKSPTVNKTSAGVDLGSGAKDGKNDLYRQWWKLTDGMKGTLTATFSHCGYYNGQEIDVQVTVMDWEFLDNNHSRGGTYGATHTSDDAKN